MTNDLLGFFKFKTAIVYLSLPYNCKLSAVVKYHIEMEIAVNPIPYPNEAATSTRVFVEPPANKLMIPQIPERPASQVVMVSGIPAMVSNEKIRQLFEHCGNIIDLWKNHLNNCLIKFENETASFNSLLMTGFTVVVETGMRYTSQMIVNYALEHEAKRPVIPFSRENYNLVSQKLSDESTLSEGTNILSTWLQNGECNRDNADDFFALLQITSASADVKGKSMRKIEETEAQLDETVSEIGDYLSVLEQVFNHENFDSILVNFPEKERQNLIQWKKEFEEAKVEINNEKQKKARNKKKKRSAQKKVVFETISREELVKLKQEKEDLELQLDVANLALVNERIEQQHEINILKQSVSAAQRQCAEYEAQLADWRIIHAQLRKPRSEEISESKEENSLSNTEAKIVTELSTYLKERLGATLSDIRNHLRRKDFNITPKNIAQLMRRFPALFKQENVGSDATKKIKWVFIGCPV
ncbi:ecto-NOX disulfide-thiol exchanger 2 [Parasteatoda tepidariorum]|uniref:ecto-NOX disulfide-thiol exchanger 2 n=1 Tax=Parasteatoda tepidariorum TaxID=114398 RepID=UPI00077FB84D|nr:uncharacterized protein LOC107443368 [Parasteatoda tepidariorum]